MDTQALPHIWAAGISLAGIASAIATLSFARGVKKQLGGILGKAINYVVLSISCIFLILLFYYSSGIYFEINGLRYPSWFSEIFISTFISLSLFLAFLAARTLKKGVELK